MNIKMHFLTLASSQSSRIPPEVKNLGARGICMVGSRGQNLSRGGNFIAAVQGRRSQS